MRKGLKFLTFARVAWTLVSDPTLIEHFNRARLKTAGP